MFLSLADGNGERTREKSSSSVAFSLGIDAPDASFGVTHIPLPPWDQINVGVTDCLPCCLAAVRADVEARHLGVYVFIQPFSNLSN
jgi:hypothetical protein